MASIQKKYPRTDVPVTSGIAAAGSLPSSTTTVSASESIASKSDLPKVPTRPFGKTGQNVSALALGGYFNTRKNQPLLKQAIRMGVTYWETASSCPGGTEGYGDYFKKNPDDRNKVFLLAKTPSTQPDLMSRHLDESLLAMQTPYIDFFIVHAVDSMERLDRKVRAWAEKAKRDHKIRFFGFSTHKNMEQCMVGASKCGWIDGIVTPYNYRLMRIDAMKKAVGACSEAGIALTAIKTQAAASDPDATKRKQSEPASMLTARFLRKGFTLEQAKLMAVWRNPNITAVCSLMPNMTVLLSNVAASSLISLLSSNDLDMLEQHAIQSASEYCAGCAHICEPTVGGQVPISDIMKCLMYSRSYGSHGLARVLYNSLPESTRKRIADLDYKGAELKCPQKMAVEKLMREASEEFLE